MKGIVLMMVMLILLAPADKVQAGNPFPPSFTKIKLGRAKSFVHLLQYQKFD